MTPLLKMGDAVTCIDTAWTYAQTAWIRLDVKLVPFVICNRRGYPTPAL